MSQARNSLEKLYVSDLEDAEKRRNKQKIFSMLAASYTEQGNGAYAGWFGGDLNNARLVALADYQDSVSTFEAVLAAVEGNLECFYAEVKKVAGESVAIRAQWLKDWKNQTADAPSCD